MLYFPLMKSQAYFWLAKYFRFFAVIVLKRWKPKIIVVTGSAGKTTALLLINNLVAQKHPVKRSVKANSAIGVPLDILGLHFTNYSPKEWITNILKTPIRAAKRFVFPYTEKYYLVELDVDRPGEMAFFASFIYPKIIFWVSSYATHAANFEELLASGKKSSATEVIAQEYARILTSSTKHTLLIMNGDSPTMMKAVKPYKARKIVVKENSGVHSFSNWQLFRKRTEFTLHLNNRSEVVTIPYLVPKSFGYNLYALYTIAEELGIDERAVKLTIENYSPLAGRSSIFEGVGDTTIIDSTYNSSYYAASSLLTLLQGFPGKRKVAVLGDMRELGRESKSEHRRLATRIIECGVEQVVLVGPCMKQYVYPYLLENGYTDTNVHHFENTYQAGLFIKERLAKPGDVILLKASQNTLFFEIIVEMLLKDKSDIDKLCRREVLWEKKRQAIKKEFYDRLNA